MIGFLLLVLFLILLGKAILETMWGGCLIIYGGILYVLFCICEILIFFDRRRKTAALCVLGICAATAISYAQTNETPITQTATAPNPNIMPVNRKLTSADGRTIDVVITAKTATSIKAKKADGNEFEIALDKLSEADKAFVAGLAEPAAKKPTLLFKASYMAKHNGEHVEILPGKHTILLGKLLAAGFNVQTELSINVEIPAGGVITLWPGIDKMSDQQIKDCDVIWDEAGGTKRLLTILPTYQGVMVMKVWSNDRIEDFLAGQIGSGDGARPYVNVDDNLIRYYDQLSIFDRGGVKGETGPHQPEFMDKAIEEVKKLLKK